ncbi:MAG TPA: D-alanine--D-alanine ligase [Sandaracinaceae bacterium LLY-WYZ-13_1]|nr:D-alanine--D-alanine ligase [Sandaracinaceae bacterium LLY-WYZ-13_1]
MKAEMTKNLRVGVLLGGLGSEREISLKTGEAVAEALGERGWDVQRIYVDRDLDRVLRQNPIDVAFIALHGPYGEDGCVQGLLELMGIPYTGSGVLASALAMDKLKSKELFRLYNVPTPPYYTLDADRLDALEETHGSFGFPVFVKPRRAGSSVGAGKASDMDELRARLIDAAQFDDSLLVERFVGGREVHVGVLDGRALGAIEIVPKGHFYDYRSKYQPGQSEYHFPARLSPTRYKGVLNIAERAAACLGVRGAARVDLLVTEGENEYVLEVNTLPGMTPTSLLPKIAAGAGMDFGDLCEAILERAHLGCAEARGEGVGRLVYHPPVVAHAR